MGIRCYYAETVLLSHIRRLMAHTKFQDSSLEIQYLGHGCTTHNTQKKLFYKCFAATNDSFPNVVAENKHECQVEIGNKDAINRVRMKQKYSRIEEINIV
ncbi:hypothetical protein ILYODFUR_026905 [Ilyodon furcidens]|uniref:Uncharacterized protein n=1 Tax=Ilyodon furcidens TaxID=33524 RepID=A0ABV0V8C6_9TELE